MPPLQDLTNVAGTADLGGAPVKTFVRRGKAKVRGACPRLGSKDPCSHAERGREEEHALECKLPLTDRSTCACVLHAMRTHHANCMQAAAPTAPSIALSEESSPESGGVPQEQQQQQQQEQQQQYGWLKSGLSRRRTSMLMFPSLAEAGQGATARKPRGRAPKDGPQRAAELRAIMEELAEQFQEVRQALH
jgi:hypothetical protein